jgi:hypothetical protein
VKGSAWSNGLEVTGGGTGVVSHAGLGLVRLLADKTGVTGGLSRASRWRRAMYPATPISANVGRAAGVFIPAAFLP